MSNLGTLLFNAWMIFSKMCHSFQNPTVEVSTLTACIFCQLCSLTDVALKVVRISRFRVSGSQVSQVVPNFSISTNMSATGWASWKLKNRMIGSREACTGAGALEMSSPHLVIELIPELHRHAFAGV